MTSGKLIPLSLDERAARLEWLYRHELAANRPALYSLKAGETGGRDPEAKLPFSLCDDGRLRADCTGVALWGQGIDRYQPRRFAPLYGGWINTDSMLIDAIGAWAVTGAGNTEPRQAVFREIVGPPRPGHLIVYSALYDRGFKLAGSIGHVMTVVAVDPSLMEWPGLVAAAERITVVHCHGGNNGRRKRAVDRVTVKRAIGGAVRRARILEMVA